MPYVKNDLDRVIDEVCRIVDECSKYDISDKMLTTDGEVYVYRKLLWGEREIVGEINFCNDRAVVLRSRYDSHHIIGRTLYCDPNFFEKIVKIIDRIKENHG